MNNIIKKPSIGDCAAMLGFYLIRKWENVVEDFV
jgi:hypothetical protein